MEFLLNQTGQKLTAGLLMPYTENLEPPAGIAQALLIINTGFAA